jgi:hypothetical protein
MRTQAERYGARILIGQVDGLGRDEDGVFTLQTGGGELRARNVLLATGLKDNQGELPDVFEAVQKGALRICPICDAYEVIDKAVGVIGCGDKAAREAMFLRTYTADLKVILLESEDQMSEENRRALGELGVEVIETSMSRIVMEDDRLAAIEFAGGVRHRFDSVYSALGTTPRTELAQQAGALTAKDGRLWVNEHQMTSIPGAVRGGRHGARAEPDFDRAGGGRARGDGHPQPAAGEGGGLAGGDGGLAAVVVKAAAGLAAEPAGLDVFHQQRARAVLAVGEPLVEHVHDRQHRVEADESRPAPAAPWVIGPELHGGVDRLDRADALVQRVDRLVEHRDQTRVDDEGGKSSASAVVLSSDLAKARAVS